MTPFFIFAFLFFGGIFLFCLSLKATQRAARERMARMTPRTACGLRGEVAGGPRSQPRGRSPVARR